jgi:hypothetical protein
MFRRPVEPHGTSGGPLTPWLVVICAWSAIAAIWLAWVAAGVLVGREHGVQRERGQRGLVLRGESCAVGVEDHMVGETLRRPRVQQAVTRQLGQVAALLSRPSRRS